MPLTARIVTLTVLVTLAAAEPAWAYVGPGAGLSLLSAFAALLMAILAAIGFLVLWPLRRLLRRTKRATLAQSQPSVRHDPHKQEVT